MKIKIEEVELIKIKATQKSTKDKVVYKKCTFLIGLSEGYSYEMLCSLLGYQDSSTYTRWKNLYISEGLESYLTDHREGYQGKLREDQLLVLEAHLDQTSYRRSQDIVTYIYETFNVKYTDAGVVELLHRLGYSYIQMTQVNVNISIEKQEACIQVLEQLKASLKDDEILLFGDGVHPTHNTACLKVWAKKGSQPQMSCNSGRDRININAVLDINNLECTYLASDTIDAQQTIELFKTIEQKYAHKQTIHLVVDNARYYKNKDVKSYLLHSKIKLIHIPPYSPNLNLIERLWRFMRTTCINSCYSPKFQDFKTTIFSFLNDLKPYKKELDSLLNFKFQILYPNNTIKVA